MFCDASARMWITAVSVRVAGWPPKGLRTCPVDVTVQFVVDESKTPVIVAVPPSRVKTYGLQVSPSVTAPAGLAGGAAQSPGRFGGWG